MLYQNAVDVLNALVRAYYHDRDVTAVLACVTEDILWVGTEKDDSAKGKAELRRLLTADAEAFPDPLPFVFSPPEAQPLGDHAVLLTVLGRQQGDASSDGFTVRGTLCCVEQDGGWLIKNLHASVPNSELEKVSLQRALDTEREKQTALLESVPGGMAMYRVKKDGRICADYVSDGLAHICGYADGKDIMKVMGYDSRKMVLPEDYPVIAKASENSLRTGVPTNVDYRIFRKDGSPVRISLDAVMMTNAELGADDVAVFYAVQALVSDDVVRAKEEQDYYRRILNITKTAYFEADEAGHFYTSESFNQYRVSAYGLPAVMGGNHAQECFHPDDLEKVTTYLHKVSAMGDFDAVSARLLMQDGTYQWTEITAHVEYDSAHKLRRMTGILRNVNPEWEKQKAQLEKELDDNRRKEETLLAGIPGGVSIYHIKQNGRVTADFVSEGFAKLCGYTAAELLALLRDDCRVNVYPEDVPILSAAITKALAHHAPLSVRYRLLKKDGTPLLLRMDGNTIHAENQQADDAAVLYAVHTPVSDESRRLLDEQAMLKKLVDEVPVGLGIYELTDTKLDQTYMNEAFYTMLGAPREARSAFTRENALLSTHPDDIALLRRTMDSLRAGTSDATLTYRVKDENGGWFWLHLSVHVVERQADKVLIYGAFSDYNRVKEAEERNRLEQERFRTVAEEMNAAVFEWNLTDNSYYSSMAFRKYAVSKVPMDDIMHNRGPLDVIHPDDLPELQRFFECTNSGAPRVESTLRVKMTEGGYRWCRMVGLFYRNENHGLTKIVGIVIDVNEEHEENVKLQRLLDEIPGGIGRYDYYQGKLALTYMNDAYYDMLGTIRKDRASFGGQRALTAIHPEDQAKTMQTLKKLEAGQNYADIYQRVDSGNGGWKWLKFATSVTERSGGHLRLITAITDCDELIRTQEVMQTKYEDQVRYTRMVAMDAVGSSMVNLTRQTISQQDTESDGIMHIITRRTPQEGFEAMYPCIPDEAIRADYAAIFNTDAIIADFDKGIDHKSIRHPYMSFDCWYESSYDALRNPKTNDLEVYCVARDVSQEVRDEDVSRRLVSQSYDEVLLIDPITGKPTVLVENGQSRVYSEQELVGDYSLGLRNYILKYSADEQPEAMAEALGLQAVTQALEHQDSYTVAYSVYNPQGRLLRRSAVYSYLNKYRTMLLCVVSNVTEAFEKETQQREALQAALAEARKASHAKADFYSRMSHDLRTPMNGILGMAALSETETDAAVLKENIKKIHESGAYLLSLVNDTLDIQRIESGKMVLEPQIVHTLDVVGNILDMVRVTAEAKGVQLVYSAGNTDLNWFIRADALRLKQIFVNLLSNAVKFTPAGGTVTLEFELLSREGMISHDAIYVRDTGVGMSKDFLEHGIFKPFSQESNAVSTQYAGSGLGLSIAKSLVELMGGRIEVESELGKGTTFTVFLDFERVSDQEAEQALASRQKQQEDVTTALTGKQLLLVEDHPLNAEIARKLLEKVGCGVRWACNGAQAVAAFRDASPHTFDAILMDIRMPVMDGLTAARSIRALDKADARTIPIIAMTANAYEEDIQASLAAGMNAHLGKPIDPKELYAALARLV